MDAVEQREQVSGARPTDTTQWLSAAGPSTEDSRSIPWTVVMPSPVVIALAAATAPNIAAKVALSRSTRGMPDASGGSAVAR